MSYPVWTDGVLDRLSTPKSTRHIPVHIISVAEAAALKMGAMAFENKPSTPNK